MNNDLVPRTKQFALSVIQFCRMLPSDPEYWVIRKQLLRSATSVGANYRAACHARSRADFIAKLSIVEEEANESQFWLELLLELDVGVPEHGADLMDEAHQIASTIVASKKTARRRQAR